MQNYRTAGVCWKCNLIIESLLSLLDFSTVLNKGRNAFSSLQERVKRACACQWTAASVPAFSLEANIPLCVLSMQDWVNKLAVDQSFSKHSSYIRCQSWSWILRFVFVFSLGCPLFCCGTSVVVSGSERLPQQLAFEVLTSASLIHPYINIAR